MFRKSVWLPILIAVLFVMGCGLFYGRKVANQEPVKIINPVTAEPVDASKPPPPGETYETGHWHGDHWHATPQAPAGTNAVGDERQVEHLQKLPQTARQLPQTAVEDNAPVSDVPFATSSEEAYQALREKYPDQTNNPHPFENVPVDLWDFEATKTAFMDHFHFYVEQGGNKSEVFNNNREVRIAYAIMENIHNAAEPTFGLFTREQCEEIKEMRRDRRRFEGYISPIDQIMEEKGVTREVAIRISTYEKLKSKGWKDEDIPAHYREAGK